MIINFPLLGNAGSGGIDSAATQAMIDASLEGYYTSGETDTKLGDYLSKVEYEPKELAVSAALNQLNTDVQTISGNTPDMSLYTPTRNFSTINGSAITEGTNIVIGGGGSGGIDSAATQAMIDASLEGYYTSGETETAIDNKLGDDLSKSEYEPKELAISAALNQLNSDVQTISGNTPDMSLYTPTSGFSTINGSAITEGTNIIIEGGGSGTELLPVSEFPESAETGTLIAKTNQEPSLGYWELSEGVLTFHLIDTGFTGSTVIGRLFNNATEPMLPGDIIITLDYDAEELGVLEYVISVENADNPGDIARIPYDSQGSIDYEFDTIGEDPESAEPIVVTYHFLADTNLIISKTNRYFDTPVAIVSTDYEEGNLPGTAVVDGIYQYDGTNWNKYEGGSASGSNIVELTQAEYDALATKDPDTLYIISDADSINMDNYALQADLTALSGSVSTSLARKADAANVTVPGSLYLPEWNTQGIITGSSYYLYSYNAQINGQNTHYINYNANGNNFNIFAPTTAGDAGKPLVSNGNGAPVWGDYKFAFLTETEYDALTTKETDTIYFVVPDPE